MNDTIYLVWTEEKTDFGTADTYLGANALAMWMGLWTWFRLDPQRVCISVAPRSAYMDYLRAVRNK